MCRDLIRLRVGCSGGGWFGRGGDTSGFGFAGRCSAIALGCVIALRRARPGTAFDEALAVTRAVSTGEQAVLSAAAGILQGQPPPQRRQNTQQQQQR